MAKASTDIWATGKRKCAIARVRLRPGKGSLVINEKAVEAYFGRITHPIIVTQPLTLTKTEQQYDIFVNVNGGGDAGQADAVSHGIARALVAHNPEFRKPLKAAGLLTRDARIKERKKYGRKKARRGFQFSKR